MPQRPRYRAAVVPAILLLLIITISTAIVRIAAFALELTGVPWEHAKFQALSAFSNSGFTTREAEQIVNHPVRRRIASGLIVLGNAGIVTTMGTFAASLVNQDTTESLVNAGMVFLVVAFLLGLMRWKAFTNRTRAWVQSWLTRRFDIQPPRADELLRLDEGYHLTRIVISDKSPVSGKELRDLDLKSWMVQILAIERHNEFKPIPRGTDRLMPQDAIIVYGAEDAVEKVFKPRQKSRLTIMGQ
jgi:hypothetical protein